MGGSRRDFRVAIVEDHSLFAEALEIAVELEGYDVRRIPLLPGVHSPTSMVAPILRARPRVVLLDLDLGHYGNGIRLIAPLTREGVAVVVVTASTDAPRWGEALWNGARVVLSKSSGLNEILAALRRLHSGLSVLGVEDRERLLGARQEQNKAIRELRLQLERLTHREAEVLGSLMAGKQVRDIAETSVVSEATVRSQVKTILAKLGVSSQLAAVGVAHRADWQPPGA